MPKNAPVKNYAYSFAGAFLACLLSLFFLLSASFHFSARDITFLVNKIEISLFSLNAAFGYLFGAASFFLAPRHFSARDITLLVDIIEVTFLPLDSQLYQFLCHLLLHLLSLFSIFKMLNCHRYCDISQYLWQSNNLSCADSHRF